MTEPTVHVLVINWNGLTHLQECFETLLAGDYPNAQFILIDNASTDGSVEFVRGRFGDDPRVAIIECPTNLGWSGGNNVGLERALAEGADYVLLLNNDTAVRENTIAELVKTAEEDPEIGALSPRILLYDMPEILNSVGLEAAATGSSWDIGIGRLDGPQWEESRPILGVCGAAFFIRVEALRKAGILPEDFGIYLDDLDLSLRIWNAGYQIRSCPSSVLRHKFSATMGEGKQARRKYYLNTRNRARIILRNYPVSKAARILPAYIIAECRALGRAALDNAWWRVWAHLRSGISALAYGPAALRERMGRRRRGISRCRFWPLVRKDLHFFPGTEFPEDGLYPPRVIHNTEVRPISVRARYRHGGGKLRITEVNPHPRLGPLDIQVKLSGELVATLSTEGRNERTLDLPPGELEFTAGRIFRAEDTGENVDLGGWIRLESR